MASCSASRLGSTVRLLDDHLAVDQRGAAGERGCRLDDASIALTPVVATAGEGAGSTAANRNFRAEAVVLDLVQPIFA